MSDFTLSGCAARYLRWNACICQQYVITLGDLQAVLDFIERERTPEVVKMHVVEIFKLTSDQVQKTSISSQKPRALCFCSCHCSLIHTTSAVSHFMLAECRHVYNV